MSLTSISTMLEFATRGVNNLESGGGKLDADTAPYLHGPFGLTTDLCATALAEGLEHGSAVKIEDRHCRGSGLWGGESTVDWGRACAKKGRTDFVQSDYLDACVAETACQFHPHSP
jgi:hypothetical protein